VSVEVVVQTARERWSRIETPAPQSEQRKSPEYAAAKWLQIYSAFGAQGEDAQDKAFAAVVAYFWKNGCSPEGDYSADVKSATGVAVPSGQIVKITGRLEGDIRKLLRATMKKTYDSLRYSPLVGTDEHMRDRAEEKGIPRDKCYLLLDALSGCEFFDATDKDLYDKASIRSIAESNARKAIAGVSTASRADNVVEAATVEEFAANRQIMQAGQYSGGGGNYGGRSAAY